MAEMSNQMPESLSRALQQQAMIRVQEDGWFAAGLDLLQRLLEAGVSTDGWCWYIPRGAFGPLLTLEASRLNNMPVYEVPPGVPLGLGLALPVCSGRPDCPVHPKPRPSGVILEHWERWMDRHQHGWRGPQAEQEARP